MDGVVSWKCNLVGRCSRWSDSLGEDQESPPDLPPKDNYLRWGIKIHLKLDYLYFSCSDCPTLGLGLKEPPEAYIPLTDEGIPLHLRTPAFAEWVSSYFNHKDIHSAELEYRVPDPSRKGTVAAMTPEEIAACVDSATELRSERYLITTFQPHFFESAKKAIFDQTLRDSWKNMKVWVLYGDKSPWHMPFSAFELSRMAKEMGKENLIHTHVLEGANHFVRCLLPHLLSDNNQILAAILG